MLCLLLVGKRTKKKKNEKRNGWGLFFPRTGGGICLAGCAMLDFHGC
jgi:hypothetical protein